MFGRNVVYRQKKHTSLVNLIHSSLRWDSKLISTTLCHITRKKKNGNESHDF